MVSSRFSYGSDVVGCVLDFYKVSVRHISLHFYYGDYASGDHSPGIFVALDLLKNMSSEKYKTYKLYTGDICLVHCMAVGCLVLVRLVEVEHLFIVPLGHGRD